MADDLNKKITIDVEVNTDGQQQIQQYKAAFDNFRSSINNIKNPLNSISGDFKTINKNVSDISGSLDKLNKTAATFNSAGSKLGGIINTAIISFVGLKDIIADLGIVIGDFTAEATAGLSLVISFLPVIVDWVSGLFSADTTTKSLNQTLKEHKAALDAVRQAQQQGAQDAQDELTHLKLLYNASQDVNLSHIQRKKAVEELQSQYPAYFGNLSQEAILAGKAAGQYKNLTQAILAAAQARAAEDMMTDNAKRQLTDKTRTDDLQKQIVEKKQQLDKLNKQYQDALFGGAYGDARQGFAESLLKQKMEQLTSDLNVLQTQYNHADTDSKILGQRNNDLSDDVAKNIEKNGVQVITGINNQTKALSKFHDKLKQVKQEEDTPPKTDNDKTPLATDVPLTAHAEATLDAPAISSAQNTNAVLQQMDNQLRQEQAVQDDAARAEKAAKDKLVAEQLKDFELKMAQDVSSAAFSILSRSIKQQSDAKIAGLEKDEASALSNTSLTGAQRLAIQQKYKQKEDQVKAKAFKAEQEASIAQAVINGALAITKVTSQAGELSPLFIPEVIAETAIQIAKIASQKPPAYAAGGLHYKSDGRGGLLPGYSRSDNTNAYLRSGEGIVVSEAMREPWARNLVSAINVGFGGRDFSGPATGSGFAVGGIFTDGGNANRYYNAPVNDQKNLANTIAYQMINNFPPVYVDVKDINNQQNILAQTINRVNL